MSSTRMAVAIENCPMGDARVIDLNALSLFDSTVPVYLDDGTVPENGWPAHAGFARNLERDENGVIRLEIELSPEWGPAEDFIPHINVAQSLWDEADEIPLLVSGVIISVLLSKNESPWDAINHRAV